MKRMGYFTFAAVSYWFGLVVLTGFLIPAGHGVDMMAPMTPAETFVALATALLALAVLALAVGWSVVIIRMIFGAAPNHNVVRLESPDEPGVYYLYEWTGHRYERVAR